MGSVKSNNEEEEGGQDVGQVMSFNTKLGFGFLIVVIVGGFLILKNK